MSPRLFLFATACWFALIAWSSAQEPTPKKPPVNADHSKQMAAGLALFKSNVRGVFIKQCVRCHGGDDTEAEFDLTTRKNLLKGGENGPAIELFDSKASRLMKLIRHEVEPEMPVDASKLPAEDIAAIGKWIDLGAPYDAPLISGDAEKTPWTKRVIPETAKEYWAFQPLAEVSPTKLEDDDWSRTDVDRFIFRKLRDAGLHPRDHAEKRLLIRRAFLDLIGLPPTPDELKAFLADDSPTAFEKVIDRLLADKHYGERWARHWLDVARFAESHGFEQDYDRPHAFHYRDFVIKALNSDMPYNQFVAWQLAGDELAPGDPQALAATGFLGAGVFPTQLTEKEFEPARYDELADMTGTMGVAMLGMTIGCARCHDHKFDPIPQADFYRLASSFTTTIRSEVDIEVPPKGIDAYQKEHQKLVDALQRYEREELPAKAEAWLAQLKPNDAPSAVWRTLTFQKIISQGGATLTRQEDGSLLVSGVSPKNDRYILVARTSEPSIHAIRLEALAHKSFVRSGPGRASNGNFALSDFRVTAAPANGEGKSVIVKLTNPRATFQQNTSSLSVASSIDGDPVSGWAVDPQFGKNHAAAFDFEQPVEFKGGAILTITMHFNNNISHSIGRPRLAISATKSPPLQGEQSNGLSNTELLKLVSNAGGFDQLSDVNKQVVLQQFRRQDEKWREINNAVQQSWNARPKGETYKVMVSTEGKKPLKHHADGRGFTHFFKQTYFLDRGDTTQKLEPAPQGFLQALMSAPEKEQHWIRPAPPEATTSHRRAALARWITDDKFGAGHQLARVVVNRLWQHHFGVGLVATPNDFGVQGERPSHPELLDFLANELIKHEWRLKPLHKQMMLSAAYMQSSNFDADAARVDPNNKLLWRFSPRRLEAEVIRDCMLAVSGELDETMFGKGTLNEAMKRRSIYFFIKRSRLVPMMQLFDSPESLVSIGDRPATTIAPQALLFMNNPHVRDYANSLAKQLLPTPETTTATAIKNGYQRVVARLPSLAEIEDGKSFVREQQGSYEKAKLPNARELAVADFCQVLFSLNEFIYVE